MYRFNLNIDKFELELRSRVIAICGNSGTGKTYLCKLINSYKAAREFDNVKFGDFYLNEILVIDYSLVDNLEDIINKKGKLIIIDNATALRSSDLQIIKNCKECQFITMTHNPISTGIGFYYVGRLHLKEDNKYGLVYSLI